MSKIYKGTGKPIESFIFPRGIEFHHSSLQRGYCSRKADGFVEPYEGRFDVGFVIHRPYWRSTSYHTVEYWLYPED